MDVLQKLHFYALELVSVSTRNPTVIYSKKRWLRIVAKYFEMLPGAMVG